MSISIIKVFVQVTSLTLSLNRILPISMTFTVPAYGTKSCCFNGVSTLLNSLNKDTCPLPDAIDENESDFKRQCQRIVYKVNDNNNLNPGPSLSRYEVILKDDRFVLGSGGNATFMKGVLINGESDNHMSEIGVKQLNMVIPQVSGTGAELLQNHLNVSDDIYRRLMKRLNFNLKHEYDLQKMAYDSIGQWQAQDQSQSQLSPNQFVPKPLNIINGGKYSIKSNDKSKKSNIELMPTLLMQKIEGTDLVDVVNQPKPFFSSTHHPSLRDTVKHMLMMIAGLHTRKVWHLDLKLENLMIERNPTNHSNLNLNDSNQQLYVIDFGSARTLTNLIRYRERPEGQVVPTHTWSYLPPEAFFHTNPSYQEVKRLELIDPSRYRKAESLLGLLDYTVSEGVDSYALGICIAELILYGTEEGREVLKENSDNVVISKYHLEYLICRINSNNSNDHSASAKYTHYFENLMKSFIGTEIKYPAGLTVKEYIEHIGGSDKILKELIPTREILEYIKRDLTTLRGESIGNSDTDDIESVLEDLDSYEKVLNYIWSYVDSIRLPELTNDSESQVLHFYKLRVILRRNRILLDLDKLINRNKIHPGLKTIVENLLSLRPSDRFGTIRSKKDYRKSRDLKVYSTRIENLGLETPLETFDLDTLSSATDPSKSNGRNNDGYEKYCNSESEIQIDSQAVGNNDRRGILDFLYQWEYATSESDNTRTDKHIRDFLGDDFFSDPYIMEIKNYLEDSEEDKLSQRLKELTLGNKSTILTTPSTSPGSTPRFLEVGSNDTREYN